MLKHFDDMKRVIELNLDKEYDFESKDRIYLEWFENDLFRFIAVCNDADRYGIVTLLGEKLFIEPNKYSNNISGIQEMTGELMDTLVHTIKTNQAQAYFNKNRKENIKYEELMEKLGLEPINNRNTFYAGKLDSIENMEKSSLVNSGILDEDIENHDKDNPVEEFDYSHSAMSKYADQICVETRIEGKNFYREVEGIPFLATSNAYGEDIKNVALNKESLRLLDRDIEGPKR